MVRNTCGGNKTKGGARKSGNHTQYGVSTDQTDQTGQSLAFVYKILGNRRVKCFTVDGRQINAFIRAKFKPSTHRIEVGTFVIIGLYEWENPQVNSDILHVYKDEIKQHPNYHELHHKMLQVTGITNSVGTGTTEHGNDICFEDTPTNGGKIVVDDPCAGMEVALIDDDDDNGDAELDLDTI